MSSWHKLVSLLVLLRCVVGADIEAAKEEKGESIPGAGLTIVFIFGGLLYGGIMKMISRKIRVTSG